MTEPIKDVEALGKVAYETCLRAIYPASIERFPDFWDDAIPSVKEQYRIGAEAVRDAVVPAGYVVVPKAEHDALMEALERLDGCLDRWDSDDLLNRLPTAIGAFVEYRAALAPEATDG